jgi:glycosyltransferase involved in cell wall biosynthesis
MRILYLSPTSCLGGAERVLLSVLAAVRAAEPSAELHVLLPGSGPLGRHAEEAGAQVGFVPMPPGLAALGDSQLERSGALGRIVALLRPGLAAAPAAWRYVDRLRRHVRRLAPDVIHSNGLKTHLLARLVAGGVPVLWHVHDFIAGRPVAGCLLRVARPAAAGAAAVSHAVAHDVARAVPGLPTRVEYNTVDADRFAPGPGDGAGLDAAAGLPPAPDGVLRVGLAATYARWKGHDVFLRAAARLTVACPTAARFYVIGGPIYQTRGSQFAGAELRTLARDLGIVGRVGFVPFQDDPAAAYRALDVVVHASTRPEPFGLTIVEGMACGKAVVAVPAGGAAELFREGHDALGVPPGDVGALADALRRLAGDRSLRARLGENGRATALARFGRAGLGPRFLQVYRDIRDGPLRSGAARRPRSHGPTRSPTTNPSSL